MEVDPVNMSRFTDETAPGVHSPEAAHDGSPAAAHRYFFVCGYQRSGTNWVASLLNLHPSVNCDGEFHFNQAFYGFRKMIDPDWVICHHEPVRTAALEGFEELVKKCLRTLAAKKPRAAWLGDRTPRELYPLIPSSPHFLVVRDGRDVLVSWTLHQLASGILEGPPWSEHLSWHLERFRAQATYFEEHPEDLLTSEAWVRYAAFSWAWRIRDDLKVVELINRGELDATVLLVNYERLHADPEGERAKMYRFLDLDPAEAAPLSNETRTLPGFTEGSPGSFYRKGRVGDWRRFDGPDFRRWFTEEAGRELVALGYDAD